MSGRCLAFLTNGGDVRFLALVLVRVRYSAGPVASWSCFGVGCLEGAFG